MINLFVIGVSVLFFTVSQATNISLNYIAKEEFDDTKSDQDILGEYNAQSLCVCSTMCPGNCCFFGYNPRLKKCRVHQTSFTSGMSEEPGWRYYANNCPGIIKRLGCFEDNSTRSFEPEHKYIILSMNNPAVCTNYCRSIDEEFKYIGLQYGSHCFCGSHISFWNRRPDSECNYTCPGDEQVTCGGYWRNEIFTI